MMNEVVIFGEVLFDHFTDGSSVLGGAPFNVAWNLNALGASPSFISRIGVDTDGDAIYHAMQRCSMNTTHLQRDPKRSTGRVDITLNEGEPSYDIVADVAYDAIDVDLLTINTAEWIYHGSLALRADASRSALNRLKENNPSANIFVDVNLRDPWWKREEVIASMHAASWVKLNGAEMQQLYPDTRAKKFSLASSEAGRAFLEYFQLSGLIITHAEKGAELLTAAGDSYRVQPERHTQVVDSIGAGDGFASVILLGLLNKWPLPIALERAQQFASAIVGQQGATVNSADFYTPFRQQWQLD